MCLISTNVENGRLEFMFDCRSNSKNGRFGRFGRPAVSSAPKGGRSGRIWRNSRFHLLNFEDEVNLVSVATVIGNFTLRCQVPDS